MTEAPMHSDGAGAASQQRLDGATGDCLDLGSFPMFAPLLEACQDFAQLSGCRFATGTLRDMEAGKDTEMFAALRKAAPVVSEFKRRLEIPEEDLRETVLRAYRLVMDESVRSGIIATCRELDMWPARPLMGIRDDDCAFEDTSAPLPMIAQRAYNDEMRRQKEDAMQPLKKRAVTASFIVDFATEVGVDVPPLSEKHKEMLQEFMSRVEEWVGGQVSEAGPSSLGARAFKAFLAGIGRGGAVASARQHVKGRWSQNWESTSGTLFNVATLGLALAAGAGALATMHRVAKGRH